MTKRQDMPSARDSRNSARPSADEGGWPPVLRALRREFRDNISRVIAGNDPVARLLGYWNLLHSIYGVDLREVEEDAGWRAEGRDEEGTDDAS